MARRAAHHSQNHERRSVADTLEERAREIVASGSRAEARQSFSVSALIDEQIGLTLQHIEDLRARGQQLRDALTQCECDIETELMQMEQRTPRYSPYRYPEREMLQRRLGQVAEEGRQLIVAQADKLDSLHDRLLVLLQRHKQLT